MFRRQTETEAVRSMSPGNFIPRCIIQPATNGNRPVPNQRPQPWHRRLAEVERGRPARTQFVAWGREAPLASDALRRRNLPMPSPVIADGAVRALLVARPSLAVHACMGLKPMLRHRLEADATCIASPRQPLRGPALPDHGVFVGYTCGGVLECTLLALDANIAKLSPVTERIRSLK